MAEYQYTAITDPGGAPPVYRQQDESDTRRAGPQTGHLENRESYQRKHSRKHRNYRGVEGPAKYAMLCGFADELSKLGSSRGKAIGSLLRANEDIVRAYSSHRRRMKERNKK